MYENIELSLGKRDFLNVAYFWKMHRVIVPWWPISAWVIIWKYHCYNRDLGRPCKTRTAHKNAHEFITLSSYFFFVVVVVEVPAAVLLLPAEHGPGCCKYEELQEAGGKGRSQGAASCVVSTVCRVAL